MNIKDLHSLFLKSSGVSIDSRTIRPNELFFAIQGEHFDGNVYAEEALTKGALKAIVSDASLSGVDFICVEDTLGALQDLAREHRSQLDIPVLGITGSNGKTTTKELISAVLSRKFKVHATPGNFNNHIGVPLTILSAPIDTEIAIIEMGANHPGEIAFLCEIANPTAGLITNIGRAHLEGFGSLEGVKRAKAELYRHLEKRQGTAFIHVNDEVLISLKNIAKTDITYTTENHSSFPEAYAAFDLLPDQGQYGAIRFKDAQNSRHTVLSPLFGLYNLKNICCALVVGVYFNVPADQMIKAIELYEPRNNRSERIRLNDNTFYLDAYNANPVSMDLAIKSFENTIHPKKILILGEMRELGNYSHKEHRALLDKLNLESWEMILLVGGDFENIKTESEDKIRYFENIDDLCTWFIARDFSEHAFLLKGSRAIRLEKLIHTLQEMINDA